MKKGALVKKRPLFIDGTSMRTHSGCTDTEASEVSIMNVKLSCR